jgi:dTDP-4-dehydrorhamnose reductase
VRILVIGAEGQLGREVLRAFEGTPVVRADLDGDGAQVDIRDEASVARLFDAHGPFSIAINTAAAHNVPACEQDQDHAFAVNATGAKHLAKACHDSGCRLVYISTDYVFDGSRQKPYIEMDLPAPMNAYAASKLAGELIVQSLCSDYQIVRTAALYGPSPCRAKGGRNFVEQMLHLAASGQPIRVVTDEITTPTYTVALAAQLRWLAERGEPGLFHATCQGSCSWFDFAKAIFEEMGMDIEVAPVSSADRDTGVKRPAYSVLENLHAQAQGLDIMPPWRDALRDYLATRPETKGSDLFGQV